MNNEIKEILAYFEEYIKIKDMHDSEPMLNWKDLKIVLDYITNLQQAIKDTKDSADDILYELKQENERIEKEWKSKLDDVSMLTSRISKAIKYINHAQNYGTMAQVMPHLKLYVNGDDLLNILQNGGDDNEFRNN